MRRAAAILLTVSSASGMMLAARVPTRVPAVRMAYTDVVRAAQERAAAVKADQDATIAAMATGFTGFFALPTIDNLFADLFLSTVIAGVIGVVAGFREDGLGDAARAVGGGVSKAVGTVAGPAIDKAKDLAGDGLSMEDVKKYGVAGTIAYILTELAFWAVAFPVASTTFYNTAGQWPTRTRTLTPNRGSDPDPHPIPNQAGHWPDFSDGGDRAAVIGSIFLGANVARLAVPLRFGVAFAAAPWVDENIVKRFGIAGDGEAETPQ